MSLINNIKKPVEKELKKFEEYFSQSMNSNIPLLKLITNYILRRKGKMIRPLLVFLSAKLNGNIKDSTYNAAAMIELLHTATLVHDDVVDESYMRRGFFSINALWKSKAAVLMGDYLLSKGMLLAIDNNEYELLKIMSDVVREMSEGELLQFQKARKLDITEELYFEIIRKKTATLLASCTASGALSVNSSQEIVNNMKLFGEYLGIAFQIRDDLLDYDFNNKSGKPVGNDLQEKKLTLPLIYALQKSSNNEKKSIIRLLNKNNSKKDRIKIIHDFVKKHKGIEYATDKMIIYRDKASAIINTYKDSPVKTSLLELLDFIVNRKK